MEDYYDLKCENEQLKAENKMLQLKCDSYYESTLFVNQFKNIEYSLSFWCKYASYLGGLAVGWVLSKNLLYSADTIFDILWCFFVLLLCGGIGFLVIWGVSSVVAETFFCSKPISNWPLFWCVIIPPILIVIYMVGK